MYKHAIGACLVVLTIITGCKKDDGPDKDSSSTKSNKSAFSLDSFNLKPRTVLYHDDFSDPSLWKLGYDPATYVCWAIETDTTRSTLEINGGQLIMFPEVMGPDGKAKNANIWASRETIDSMLIVTDSTLKGGIGIEIGFDTFAVKTSEHVPAWGAHLDVTLNDAKASFRHYGPYWNPTYNNKIELYLTEDSVYHFIRDYPSFTPRLVACATVYCYGGYTLEKTSTGQKHYLKIYLSTQVDDIGTFGCEKSPAVINYVEVYKLK